MAGRGPQSFKKRQKEQQRKERQLAKAEKRLQRQREGGGKEPDAEAGEAAEERSSDDLDATLTVQP